MRVAVIVQARMGSTRLPGKVLKPVLGKPLLSYQFERLRRARTANVLVLATSTLPADDALEAWAMAEGVLCVRGSESDVLDRFRAAAAAARADVVVRVTGDCPLIDPGVLDDAVTLFLAEGAKGYGSNCNPERTFPRGLDVEVFSREALEEAAREAKSPAEREHVTPYLIRRPERFPPVLLHSGESFGSLRWTVDAPEDFELVKRVLEALHPANPGFGWREVLALLKRHPDWAALNAHVEQKKA
jgi:spore coat polysaccharide biosynthesis protein SpsF